MYQNQVFLLLQYRLHQQYIGLESTALIKTLNLYQHSAERRARQQ